jgi:hypothetical protein
VQAEASERRSQEQNRHVALLRLRVNLALAVRGEIDAGTYQPSELWRRRCRGGRIIISAEHKDFPALLSETLDILARGDWDMKLAARTLDCTASQLLKVLRAEPRALVLVNQQRKIRGLLPLK